jgi:hypothetical protein
MEVWNVDWIVAFYGMGKFGAKTQTLRCVGIFLRGFGTKKDSGYDMILSWVLFNDADYEIHDE